MKNSLYVLYLSLVICLFSACDNILDQYPQSEVVPENSFKSESELKLYINGLLPMLNGSTSESADNVVLKAFPDYMFNNRRASDGGSWSWTSLRQINILLAYSKNCTDQEIRSKYNGMARFLRALFYFDKLKTFGGVPWYNQVLTEDSEELYKPRDTRELIADSILADLSYAIDKGVTDKKLNEITKWTALALKSRFCLFEGTFRKYHAINGYEKFLNECVSASEQLRASGKYQIDMGDGTDVAYRDLFAQPKTSNASDVEVITARGYSTELGVKHSANYAVINLQGNRPGLEKQMIDSYLMKDGTRFTDKAGYEKMSFYEETQDRDPRLAQTIRTPGYKRVNETALYGKFYELLYICSTGYMPIKYFAGRDSDPDNCNENDVIVYRYAEVLLNLAEAKAELGTITQADIDNTITLIRKRVGMPSFKLADANANPDNYLVNQYPLVAGSNKGAILEIRRERRIELALEEFRFDDMVRWKDGQQFVRQFKGAYFPGEGAYDLDGDGTNDVYLYSKTPGDWKGVISSGRLKLGSAVVLENGTYGNVVVNADKISQKVWDENKDYLYPIPTQAIVLNPKLEQNPGWE